MIEQLANKHGLALARVAGESSNAFTSILSLDTKLTQLPKSFILAGHTFKLVRRASTVDYECNVTGALQFCVDVERVSTIHGVKARHFSVYLALGSGEPLYEQINDNFSVYGYVTKAKIQIDDAGLDNFGYVPLDEVQAADLVLSKLKNTIEAVSSIKDKDAPNGKRLVKRTKFKSLQEYVKAVKDLLDGKKIVRYAFNVPSNNAAMFDQELNKLLQKHGVEITR